jgi:hypothetical protein
MATPGCELNDLLAIFADNTTQNISPADMRQFVTCVYSYFLEISEVIDNLETYDAYKALSANQGALLSDKVEIQAQDIVDLKADKANADEVYTKGESDQRYYTQDQIDASIYTKNEVYTKQEVDNAMFAIQQEIQNINARLDCIVSHLNINC